MLGEDIVELTEAAEAQYLTEEVLFENILRLFVNALELAEGVVV